MIVAFVKELPPRFALGEHAIEPSEERTAASNSYVMPGSETRPTRRRVELSKHVTLGAGMSVRAENANVCAKPLLDDVDVLLMHAFAGKEQKASLK